MSMTTTTKRARESVTTAINAIVESVMFGAPRTITQRLLDTDHGMLTLLGEAATEVDEDLSDTTTSTPVTFRGGTGERKWTVTVEWT